MNELKFSTGGMRLEGDDFKFQFDAHKEAIEAIYKSFLDSNQNAVAWGCDVTDGSPNITSLEGYVVLDGELRYMPAQSVAKLSNSFDDFVIVPDDSFSATGTETLIDGGTLEMWNVRRAKIEYNAAPSQPYIRVDEVESKRIERLIDKIVEQQSVSFQNGFSVALASTVKVQRHGNHVSLSGQITGTSGQDAVTVFNVDEEFRPRENSVFICYGGSLDNFAFVQVASSGVVSINYTTTGTALTINLAPIQYLV